jgi:hypothetical protein
MTQLKERIMRDLDELSPGELLIVQQVVGRLKRAREPQCVRKQAAQKVRAALAPIADNLSELIAQEREERI